MKKITTLIAALMFAAVFTLNGQDFSVSVKGGNRLFFNITDTIKKTVEVVRPRLVADASSFLPSGSMEIPKSVAYKNVLYTVTSIGNGALAKAEGLTFVTIPSSVTNIGARAFEGCKNLESVVFPASQPVIGEGAFDDDPLLATVSFGSDWHSIDFNLFASSASLESVTIPAKVNKISNLKGVKALKEIIVDVNNPAFSSIDGLLYSKDGKALYSCPSGRNSDVEVASGTEKIINGAFKNCDKIKSITLPATVHEFAYCEFDSCSQMESITILADIPPITAKWNGVPVFALRLANNNAKLFVPRQAVSSYRRTICFKDGVYECMTGEHEASLTSNQMLNKKAIVRIKACR